MEAYVSGREKTLRVTMTTALVIFMVRITVQSFLSKQN